jgi:[ribosomal protein S5]-alanine N-acetyltransferase
MKLDTPRLELRSATPEDAPDLLTLFTSPSVLQYIPSGPQPSLQDIQQRIGRRAEMEAQFGFAPLVIVRKEDRAFVGSGGLQPVKDTTDVELAYHLLPSAWGKGYATEVARAVLEFGLGTRKLPQVVGVAYVENVASWKVMEKVGMRYVGLRTYHGIDGVKMYVAEQGHWVAP